MLMSIVYFLTVLLKSQVKEGQPFKPYNKTGGNGLSCSLLKQQSVKLFIVFAKVTIIVKTPIHRLDQIVNYIIAVNNYLEQTEVFVLFG